MGTTRLRPRTGKEEAEPGLHGGQLAVQVLRQGPHLFEYLSLFKEYADEIGMDEVDAYQVLPHTVHHVARETIHAGKRLGRSSPRGIINWPTAVQALLVEYATNENIREAVDDFTSVRQLPDETEEKFFHRFQQAHARAGSYLKEDDQVTQFVESLRAETRPKVRVYHDANPKAGLLAVMKIAKAEGDAWRAARAAFPMPKDLDKGGLPRRGGRGGTGTAAMAVDETGAPIGAAVNLLGNAGGYDADDGYTDSDSDHAHQDATGAVLMGVGQYSQRGKKRGDDFTKAPNAGWSDGKGGTVPNDGKAARPARPLRTTTICYRCYKVGDHYANGCTTDVKTDGPIIIAQFENLTHAQKCRVPWGAYLGLKGYYTPDMEHTKGPLDNPFCTTVPNASADKTTTPTPTTSGN